jgi:hypothetical protein
VEHAEDLHLTVAQTIRHDVGCTADHLSAITWAGYDNFYYRCSHADSRDAFAIPHDLRIPKEVFGLEPGGYNARNLYWRLVAQLPAAERQQLTPRIDRLTARYAALSRLYQESKAGNAIPLNQAGIRNPRHAFTAIPATSETPAQSHRRSPPASSAGQALDPRFRGGDEFKCHRAKKLCLGQ